MKVWTIRSDRMHDSPRQMVIWPDQSHRAYVRAMLIEAIICSSALVAVAIVMLQHLP